ncbi:hypothetical protein C2845_PM17G09660 [Panicum miliaceum]|uniref:Uncharacterized protein n=1 Tax=Panicum miliaceum TaxID=4540 RepID=A0A3L6Q4D3_PANMI|nr:hypothetical protein C2845_PM17G09660 [Panicum miliaceum]
MTLQHDGLERRASARASARNNLKRASHSLEFRPEERLGLVSGRIHRWIKKAFHCLALRKFEREFDVELHGTDDDRELMAPHNARHEASGMPEIDRSVARVHAAIYEASVCLDVQFIAETTLSDSVRRMIKKSDDMYNSNLHRSENSAKTSDPDLVAGSSGSRMNSQFSMFSQPHRNFDSSTGGKLPLHGPRREDVVNLCGVRCTYWAIGVSLKPGGLVKLFVVSAFCYSLFQRPNGHPDTLKRYYFFSNISENLLKDIENADKDVLSRVLGNLPKLDLFIIPI